MLVEAITFWVFALLAIGAALGVVFHRSVIYAAMFLIVVFLSIAGIFVLNNADFLAVAQTIVYGVGLTIVILFGIMFTGDRLFQDSPITKRQTLMYMTVGVFFLVLILPVALTSYPTTPMPTMLVNILQADGTTGLIGESLFTQYALPFEVASVLLLLAMIGAIVLSKKTFDPAANDEDIKYDLTESEAPEYAQNELERRLFSRDFGQQNSATEYESLNESEDTASTAEPVGSASS